MRPRNRGYACAASHALRRSLNAAPRSPTAPAQSQPSHHRKREYSCPTTLLLSHEFSDCPDTYTPLAASAGESYNANGICRLQAARMRSGGSLNLLNVHQDITVVLNLHLRGARRTMRTTGLSSCLWRRRTGFPQRLMKPVHIHEGIQASHAASLGDVPGKSAAASCPRASRRRGGSACGTREWFAGEMRRPSRTDILAAKRHERGRLLTCSGTTLP